MAPSQAPEPPSRDLSPLVLVVEDEFLIALELERVLGRQGWRVLGPAPTVGAALRLLDGGGARPDAAVLDELL